MYTTAESLLWKWYIYFHLKIKLPLSTFKQNRLRKNPTKAKQPVQSYCCTCYRNGNFVQFNLIVVLIVVLFGIESYSIARPWRTNWHALYLPIQYNFIRCPRRNIPLFFAVLVFFQLRNILGNASFTTFLCCLLKSK